ncbi:MAG TPA: FKBP-type peptidyl-prolyl cis-trans isomerase [Gammaproteobacteria bacterium]|nr:FKBP-type peptidyl-prolyl cis-trans isomerase [Gammaproteobacteria bacterium]
MKAALDRVLALLLAGLLCTSALAAGPFNTTPRGARYQDLQPGSGAVAAPGDLVTMHFTGWLDDRGRQGKELYNSRREGHTVSFVVGTDRVMPGWSEGVTGMQPGGRRLVLLPPALGYGARAVDKVIPANSSLMFMIELLDVRPSAPGNRPQP